MTCRDEILATIKRLGLREFTPQEVIDAMRKDRTGFADSTIRTHIVSRLCANAPDNHAVTYDDLVRVDHGVYRLKR
ncbi:MAG: hypothetical protein KJZ69_18415 [Phycisphaerales bacterium]|nr:hypothetical protein [Phycisphaerales bacterium]